MVRIASFNVENLFSRPRALNLSTWSEGRPILDAYSEVNALFEKPSYSVSDKKRMRELLLKLDVYAKNSSQAIRRKQTQTPRWAWLRKNKGSFDREPNDPAQSVEITANSRADWIGWVELAKENVDEEATRMTARVIRDVRADIFALVEVEDRPALVRFNDDLLEEYYRHAMLVDGNDERGIDVGIMCRKEFEITSIRSNVDTEDDEGIIFSRDCPQYEVRTPGGTTVHILVNHFKSQSGGGDKKRRRQAAAVRRIADDLVAAQKHVVVVGDLNEGPKAGNQADNLAPLYENNSPLLDCYSLTNAGFRVGNRPGTFDSCGLRNRLDYIMISKSLRDNFRGGEIVRTGLWGSRKTRPDDWLTYPDLESSTQASDHAAIYIDLDI